MKTTKFRGISIGSGEWVYGFYVVIGGKHYIVGEAAAGCGYRLIEVDPRTVGQYTGFKDIDGKEVYEWDLLKVWIQGWLQKGYVVVKDLRELYLDFNRDDTYYLVDNVKVVGNIFDNPELLVEEAVEDLVSDIEARANYWQAQGSFSVSVEPDGIDVWSLTCRNCDAEVEAFSLDELVDVVRKEKWGLIDHYKIMCPSCLINEIKSMPMRSDEED